MPRTLRLTGLVNCLALTLLTAAAGAGGATPPVHGAANDTPPHDAQGGPEYEPVVKQPHLDLTGRKRVGKASFYAKRFAGKKMADGTPMLPHSDNAASKTLPLGTTAKVTNLETGQSAVVTIRDRGTLHKGPYRRPLCVDCAGNRHRAPQWSRESGGRAHRGPPTRRLSETRRRRQGLEEERCKLFGPRQVKTLAGGRQRTDSTASALRLRARQFSRRPAETGAV